MLIRPHFINFVAEDFLDVDMQPIIEYAYELKSRGPGKTNSNYGGWHSDNLDKTHPVLKPLFDAIQIRLDDLHTQLGFKREKFQKIGNAWININTRGNYNTPHIHPNSFFSGCIYLKVPRNSGNIVFFSPIDSHSWAIRPDDIETLTPYNRKWIKIIPTENLLLLFPPWMLHTVEPSECDEDRISIAFNTGIKKKPVDNQNNT